MPAYVWVTVLAAVAFALFIVAVKAGLPWWRSVRYSRHPRHECTVETFRRAGDGLRDRYGSMSYDAELDWRAQTGWLPAPPVDPEPWRARMTAELSPEALGVHYGDGSYLPDPGQLTDIYDYPPPREFPSPSRLADTGDIAEAHEAHPQADWLAAQMADLFDWVRGMWTGPATVRPAPRLR